MIINAMGAVSLADPNVYCGDLCGRGCSHDEFKLAVGQAESAASVMPGWTANVWENLGWHWSLVKESGGVRWNLSLNRAGKWECYSYGAAQQTWTVGYPTPQEAVQGAIDALIKQMVMTSRDIKALTGLEV